MRYLKVAGIVWGFAYFLFGAWSSFTLNSIDFWSSVTLLFCLFLLPLPIALVAVWFPRSAGKALLGCVVVSMGVVACIVATDRQFSLGGWISFIAETLLFNAPHLLFGSGYIFLGRARTGSDSGSGEQSIGTA